MATSAMRGAAILIAAATAGAAAAEQISAVGTWTVTAVETDPDMPVTAVVADDPAYMGAKLTIAASRIGWSTGATNGQGTYDDCVSPRFRPADGGLAVLCGNDGWGPDATLTPLAHHRLRLDWYDGGRLVLTRD